MARPCKRSVNPVGDNKSDSKKPDDSGASGLGRGDGESSSPSFDEVVRKMLNTPPKPKKRVARVGSAKRPSNKSDDVSGSSSS